jgi:hypothetical protein
MKVQHMFHTREDFIRLQTETTLRVVEPEVFVRSNDSVVVIRVAGRHDCSMRYLLRVSICSRPNQRLT